MNQAHILVVDDEPAIGTLLKEILEDEGYKISVAGDATQARLMRQKKRPDLILLDIWMPDTDGISLLKEWSENSSLDCPVIMMSGHGTVETAVEATRLGAYDFVEKPLSTAKILLSIHRAIENATLAEKYLGLKRNTNLAGVPVDRCTGLADLRSSAQRIANHKSSVLICGETGTGKESLARYIHACSHRSNYRFVSANASGTDPKHLDKELFGVENGRKIIFGSLELANRGTLFVKGVDEMDLGTQAKLVNALENQTIIRVGGEEQVELDVRVIASTRGQLQELVQSGSFREDLFYYLNVLPLTIPPLRDRLDDINVLIDFFTDSLVNDEGLPGRSFPIAARSKLKGHLWPGNCRELKNFIQRLLILGTTEEIEISEIDTILGTNSNTDNSDNAGFDLPLRQAREHFERAYLEFQLRKYGGNVSRVSESAGIERTHLYRKLRNLGLDPKQKRASGKE